MYIFLIAYVGGTQKLFQQCWSISKLTYELMELSLYTTVWFLLKRFKLLVNIILYKLTWLVFQQMWYENIPRT